MRFVFRLSAASEIFILKFKVSVGTRKWNIEGLGYLHVVSFLSLWLLKYFGLWIILCVYHSRDKPVFYLDIPNNLGLTTTLVCTSNFENTNENP